MKTTILQNIGLTGVILVASLALSAQAGQPFSASASQSQRSGEIPEAPQNNSAPSGDSAIHVPAAPALPQAALWYNGDFDGVDGLTNEQDTFAPGYSRIYDDFNVNDSEGWDVDSVFSNNLISTTVTGATWEIRQGITSGNGGALIASGTTMAPNVTPTGRSGFGFTEFMVEVTGLSVHLDPGTYHLNVTPIGNLDGNRSFNSTTDGTNCIGTPCGDNDNAFLDSTLFGANFEPVADFGGQFHDFSMGVNGTVSGGGGGGLTLESAASIQRGFAIDLPLSGPSGVEDRRGHVRRYFIQMTFNNPIKSVGSASTTCGNILRLKIEGNTVTITVSNVGPRCDQSEITITANDVMDKMGNSLSSASATMGLLLGDVNGDRVVDQTDVDIIKASKGPINGTNFRSDVNNDGFVSTQDAILTDTYIGDSLP